MHFLFRIIVVQLLIVFAKGQRCPFNWFGYNQQSKCYRFFTSDGMSWNDARGVCQIHGGDLLRIDSAQELNYINNQLKYRQQHNHVPASNWWIGLNNAEYITSWTWADNTQVGSFITAKWARGAPNNANGSERCGEIVNGNQFNDEDCSDHNKFICYRDRGVPLLCDADRGWQSLNGACYKVQTDHKTFAQARQVCKRQNSDLVTIQNINDQQAMHDYAVTNHQPFWIGLQALHPRGAPVTWAWVNGTSTTPVTNTYWHDNRPPGIGRGTCAVVLNQVDLNHSWLPNQCTQTRAYVCRKPEGTCMPGWLGHGRFCYQFNVHYRVNYNAAVSFCQQEGSQLLKVDGATTQTFVNSYLQEMKDSGVGSIWIGASDDGRNGTNAFKWRDHTNIGYSHWMGNHTPASVAHRTQCSYMATSERNGFWHATTNCNTNKQFVCRIQMGRRVLALKTTPRPTYGCPSGWRQQQSNCFKAGDRSLTWTLARQACRNMSVGADLAVINVGSDQSVVNRLLQSGIIYWIGLNDRQQDGVYVWNDGQALSSYTNWAPTQPNNLRLQQNCVGIENNQWNDFECRSLRQFVCSKVADSVYPSLPPTTPARDWTVKCGPGWESNPLSAYCYMFVDKPLSWLDAHSECTSLRGGHLVSIESASEQSYVAGKVQSLNSLAVWTGANDRATEGGWQWIGGAPFAFFNWADGQPDGAGGNGTDCVAMFTQTGLWDDLDCSARNGFVCEKLGNVPPTTAVATTTPRVPAGKVLGCDVGWLPFQSSCFRIFQGPRSWSNAQLACHYNGAELTSIRNRAEQNFLQGNLPKPKLSWDGFWIGLNDQQTDNRFLWTDGSTVTYTKWNINEPNNYMNRNEDCVEMRLASGRWNDEVCSMVRPGFICRKAKHAVSATQAPYSVGCPQAARGYGVLCYRMINFGAPLNYNQASNFCQTRFNGTLATIYGRVLQAFITSMLNYQQGNFLIGLTDKKTPGTFYWAAGNPVGYTNWVSSHTGNEQNTCVAMQTSVPAGLWKTVDCNQGNRFICQFSRTGFTLPPTTPTLFPNTPCPTGYTADGPYCLHAITALNARRTWMSARSYCQALGGDLPSFHSNYNDSILTTMLAKYKGMSFWIGLNDRDTEAGYVWSDGTGVDYTNWNSNEPNDFKGQEDCVLYQTLSNKWNDNTCYLAQAYICALPRGTTLSRVTIPPKFQHSSLCGSDPSWLYYNNSCYMVSPRSGDNSSVNWYDAQAYCNAAQSNLASIHDLNENNFLTSIVGNTAKNEYWLGLNALDNNGFKWIDGMPLGFINWNPGQPDNYMGGEKCVVLRKYNSFWNDQHCDSPDQGFVCKKPAQGVAKVVVPSPFPPGGCPHAFVRVPGGRNKCFLIGGKQPTDRLNFTAAVNFCRHFGPGYDIVSVEDKFEQQFIITMTNGWRNSFWIGLSDRVHNNQFFWQDNTPLVYTNWDRGEPTSAQKNAQNKEIQSCVVMRMYRKGFEGRWADTDCSQSQGYVCQTRQVPSLAIVTPASQCTRAGYVQYRKSCYRPSIPSDARTWSDAQSICQNEGGNLVCIQSVFESAFVHSLISQNYSYWIGLSDTKIKGLYGWADGWPVGYTNWGWKEPSYNQQGTGCVVANTNGKWNDTSCTRLMRYVCEISSVPPPTTLPPAGSCLDKDYVPNGDFCYKAFVNQGRSWPEADRECSHAGGNIASIHSQSEMDFVFYLVQQAKVTNPQYQPNIWLGLEQGGQGGYTWTDGSAVNFVRWTPGEPTLLGAHGQVEECIEFDRTKGTWNDISCYTNRGYVCKSQRILSTKPPVATPSAGGLIVNQGNDSFVTYKAQTGPIALRTGQGYTQLPGISVPYKPGSQQQLQQGNNGNNVQTSSSNLGMSNGGIAGVVLGCIIAIALIAVALILLKRRGVIKAPPLGETGNLGFDNAMYSRSDDSVKLDSDA
ncbi:macrophage mannose receptor 1-like [Mya arenaria]|uniref:macrophage mannose receptor 1-like n=1 Tax=Mya arenaria TaxID=6604 RepID=UPI0022E38063|nr:macrophage mannose receptor 1-like [Mya arenaria]